MTDCWASKACLGNDPLSDRKSSQLSPKISGHFFCFWSVQEEMGLITPVYKLIEDWTMLLFISQEEADQCRTISKPNQISALPGGSQDYVLSPFLNKIKIHFSVLKCMGNSPKCFARQGSTEVWWLKAVQNLLSPYDSTDSYWILTQPYCRLNGSRTW